MTGHRVHFVHGFSAYGSHIEQLANHKSLEPVAQRSECREFAKASILSQMESFSKWGIMTDFRYSYLTMQPLYESNVLEKFADLVQKGGVIARG